MLRAQRGADELRQIRIYEDYEAICQVVTMFRYVWLLGQNSSVKIVKRATLVVPDRSVSWPVRKHFVKRFWSIFGQDLF